MPITLGMADTRCVLRLEGEIDISSSEELKAKLLEASSPARELAIEMEGAIDLDITAVQLLWSAAREAEKAGRSLFALHVSEGVRSSVHDMGFEHFPVPASPPAAPETSMPVFKESPDDR